MSTCNTIRVHIPNVLYAAGATLPTDPIDPTMVSTIELPTVTTVETDTVPVYEEGGVRIVKHETTFSVSAVIAMDDYEVGHILRPFVGTTFQTVLQNLHGQLTRQGLIIEFINYPTPFWRVIPNVVQTPRNATGTTDLSGVLIDNSNGPFPLECTFLAMAGSNTVMLTYRFKTVTAASDFGDDSAYYYPPKIASELRLDIDKDGDLMIIYDGTVFANTVSQIYEARDWLQLQYRPVNTTGISATGPSSSIPPDVYSQLNGFFREFSYNIEKNGLSAKFSFRYTQVKSNSAFPLGIRDLEFDQEIESSLLSGDVFSGAAFKSWKTTFSGRIRVPHRMPVLYAWYLIHLMITQRMRRTAITLKGFSSLEDTLSATEKQDEEIRSASAIDTGPDSKPPNDDQPTRAYPIAIKLKNKVFSREISFDIQFVVVSPLAKILTTTCLFDRMNNEYHRALNLAPGAKYEPLNLSTQWLSWDDSTNPGSGFDPTDPSGTNPFTIGLPNRDNAGTEIIDTGHQYDARRNIINQARQRAALISTVVDPNEKDEAYTKQYQRDVTFPLGGDQKSDLLDPSLGDISERTVSPPIKPFSINRELQQVDPENSWIKYEQTYIIEEEHGNFSVEALAPLSKDYYSGRSEFERFVSQPGSGSSFDPPVESFPNMRAEVGTGFSARQELTDQEDDTPDQFIRKTYATKPTRFYLRVKGMALRARYKIPIPEVISIAGEPAIRVGKSRTFAKTIGTGSDLPLNLLLWEQVYTVDKNLTGKDILSSIETTGANILYA